MCVSVWVFSADQIKVFKPHMLVAIGNLRANATVREREKERKEKSHLIISLEFTKEENKLNIKKKLK